MKCNLCGGVVIDREVSYTIEVKERLHIIEHVPAKECLQCGERLYSPEIVEKIQKPFGKTKNQIDLSKHQSLTTCLLDNANHPRLLTSYVKLFYPTL